MAGYGEWGNERSGSIKGRQFVSLAEDLLASQQVLCSVELVRQGCGVYNCQVSLQSSD